MKAYNNRTICTSARYFKTCKKKIWWQWNIFMSYVWIKYTLPTWSKLSFYEETWDSWDSQNIWYGLAFLRIKYLEKHYQTSDTPYSRWVEKVPLCRLWTGKAFQSNYSLKNTKISVHLKLRPYKCWYGCDMSLMTPATDFNMRKEFMEKCPDIILT